MKTSSLLLWVISYKENVPWKHIWFLRSDIHGCSHFLCFLRVKINNPKQKKTQTAYLITKKTENTWRWWRSIAGEDANDFNLECYIRSLALIKRCQTEFYLFHCSQHKCVFPRITAYFPPVKLCSSKNTHSSSCLCGFTRRRLPFKSKCCSVKGSERCASRTKKWKKKTASLESKVNGLTVAVTAWCLRLWLLFLPTDGSPAMASRRWRMMPSTAQRCTVCESQAETQLHILRVGSGGGEKNDLLAK